MGPVKVAEFDLRIEFGAFLCEFWTDPTWYEAFLRETLGDRDITIGDWSTEAESGVMVRDVKSYHPSKISFPGMPSFAESIKSQSVEITLDNEDEQCAVIRETNNIRGIPYADYFCINIKWDVTHKKKFDMSGNAGADSRHNGSPGSQLASPSLSLDESDCGGPHCHIIVWLEFEFFKYTWLQGTIESNTQSELVGLYEQWQEAAGAHIRSLARSTADVETGQGAAGEYSSVVVRDVPLNDVVAGSSGSGSSSIRTQPSSSQALLDEELGDVVFYDCVDGGDQLGGAGGSMGTLIPLTLSAADIAAMAAGGGYGNSPRGSISGFPRSNSFTRRESQSQMLGQGQTRHPLSQNPPLTTRDVAVTVVETVFVVAEASIWRMHAMYRGEWSKALFAVAPDEVLRRILHCVVPGMHGAALSSPDLYGPLLAVLLLPQILLLSIDVTLHGCSQTSMLGNATVVSLSLWCGLSVLYRLLALIIAPGLRLKHCLCVAGYSFFPWSLALLCSYPLEKHKVLLSGWVPGGVALPLVLFGIPAALAQGWLFWEYTPYASPSMQQALFPTSVQHFAQRHSRLLQKALWAVPKVAALVVVAGTHYQLLWYLARVFLPGRKHLCNLTALTGIDRGQLTDVLSQKELRKYALLLLRSGQKDD